MTESGINSIEEFVLFYLVAGFIVGALWVVFEADVVLGTVDELHARRRRRMRLTRALAPLGALHIGFALLAADAARRDYDEPSDPVHERRRRRAALEARAWLLVGVLVGTAIAMGL